MPPDRTPLWRAVLYPLAAFAPRLVGVVLVIAVKFLATPWRHRTYLPR